MRSSNETNCDEGENSPPQRTTLLTTLSYHDIHFPTISPGLDWIRRTPGRYIEISIAHLASGRVKHYRRYRQDSSCLPKHNTPSSASISCFLHSIQTRPHLYVCDVTAKRSAPLSASRCGATPGRLDALLTRSVSSLASISHLTS